MQELAKTSINPNSNILLVGAGKTMTLVSKFLNKKGFKGATVFNRSIDGARKIAEKLSGEAYELEVLRSYGQTFDCIIVCTGSVAPIITPSLYGNLIKEDSSNKVIVDLSVPNNVSPAVVEENNVDYICVESLKELSEENLRFRQREVDIAETMLVEALEAFRTKCKERVYETAFHQIPSQIKAIKQHAMDTVFKSDMEELDTESKALVEKMLSYMEKKCISIPMKVVRELAQ